VDVDHFKAINDRHSHATGDRVLAAVAQVPREQMRESDLAALWGGDELLVISRSCDGREAAVAAERIRRAVAALVVPDGDATITCTVSIGWAAFPFLASDPRALTWEQTVDLADRALLFSKRHQRDSCTGMAAT